MIRVFISSVQREFAEERQQLCKYIREDALLGKFFVPFIFEELPAINLSAPEAYLAEASSSDIYLGLYGHDYGYEDAEGVSPMSFKRSLKGGYRVINWEKLNA